MSHIYNSNKTLVFTGDVYEIYSLENHNNVAYVSLFGTTIFKIEPPAKHMKHKINTGAWNDSNSML